MIIRRTGLKFCQGCFLALLLLFNKFELNSSYVYFPIVPWTFFFFAKDHVQLKFRCLKHRHFLPFLCWKPWCWFRLLHAQSPTIISRNFHLPTIFQCLLSTRTVYDVVLYIWLSVCMWFPHVVSAHYHAPGSVAVCPKSWTCSRVQAFSYHSNFDHIVTLTLWPQKRIVVSLSHLFCIRFEQHRFFIINLKW